MSTHKNNAQLFKAFCDESRLKIIEQLSSGEQCACHLLEALPISQSTLSHHMKILVESGIVSSRKEGKWVHYALRSAGVQEASNFITTLTTTNAENNNCQCGN